MRPGDRYIRGRYTHQSRDRRASAASALWFCVTAVILLFLQWRNGWIMAIFRARLYGCLENTRSLNFNSSLGHAQLLTAIGCEYTPHYHSRPT